MTSGQVVRGLIGFPEVVLSVAFSPDGRFALSGGCRQYDRVQHQCTQGEAILWDVTTGQVARILIGQRVATPLPTSTNGTNMPTLIPSKTPTPTRGPAATLAITAPGLRPIWTPIATPTGYVTATN